jgi:adenylate cyclase class IV
MISEHNEIEAKMAAGTVDTDRFLKWMFSQPYIERYIHVTGPDRYYENGPNVVRHREDRADGRHELTVKLRKSDGSTRDRLEIDLHFGKKTKPKDVDAFLKATGFTKVFTLVKEAHIFWVRLTDDVLTTFVIYDVWRDKGDGEKTEPHRFIEVEVEKGSDVTADTAKRHLRAQVKLLQAQFELSEPLNESLYEIYSGKKYQQV